MKYRWLVIYALMISAGVIAAYGMNYCVNKQPFSIKDEK